MRIRHYRIADWNVVCSIFDLAKPDKFKVEFELPLIPALNNDTKMKALFHESEVFVAEQDAQVVGFAGTRGNYVSWLFVHPLYRRAGVAKNLIQEVIRGLNGTIELKVAKSNEAASRLYEGLGFVAQHEFLGNFNGQDCQVVRLSMAVRSLWQDARC